MSAQEIGTADPIEVRVEVTNTGDRAGAEVVQLYIGNLVSTVARPVKELRGFAKISLQPGETRPCSFKLGPNDLAMYDRDLHRVVEPGEYQLMIGASSEDIRAETSFRVTQR